MIVDAKTQRTRFATAGMAFRRSIHGALLIGLIVAASACSTPEATKQAEDSARLLAVQAREAPAPRDYHLEQGDKITLKFPYNPDLNDTLQIRPDGKISVQIAGDVVAAGRSIGEVSAELKQRYSNVLRDPELTVNVDTYRAQVVYVGGEVHAPGVVALAPGMTVLQGIVSAGGYLQSSNLKKVLIIREQGTDKPQMLMVDLNPSLQALDTSDNLRLRARDMVVVPMSGVARAGVIVQQYINDILPFSRSVNLNYDFGQQTVIRGAP